MINLLRNKRKLYLCNVSLNNGVKTYSKPIELYEHYQVADTDADRTQYGLDWDKHIRIKTNINHLDYYHLGDRLYIYTTPPTEYDNLCKTADYEVERPPKATFNEVEIMLKRLGGR